MFESRDELLAAYPDLIAQGREIEKSISRARLILLGLVQAALEHSARELRTMQDEPGSTVMKSFRADVAHQALSLLQQVMHTDATPRAARAILEVASVGGPTPIETVAVALDTAAASIQLVVRFLESVDV